MRSFTLDTRAYHSYQGNYLADLGKGRRSCEEGVCTCDASICDLLPRYRRAHLAEQGLQRRHLARYRGEIRFSPR